MKTESQDYLADLDHRSDEQLDAMEARIGEIKAERLHTRRREGLEEGIRTFTVLGMEKTVKSLQAELRALISTTKPKKEAPANGFKADAGHRYGLSRNCWSARPEFLGSGWVACKYGASGGERSVVSARA